MSKPIEAGDIISFEGSFQGGRCVGRAIIKEKEGKLYLDNTWEGFELEKYLKQIEEVGYEILGKVCTQCEGKGKVRICFSDPGPSTGDFQICSKCNGEGFIKSEEKKEDVEPKKKKFKVSVEFFKEYEDVEVEAFDEEDAKQAAQDKVLEDNDVLNDLEVTYDVDDDSDED